MLVLSIKGRKSLLPIAQFRPQQRRRLWPSSSWWPQWGSCRAADPALSARAVRGARRCMARLYCRLYNSSRICGNKHTSSIFGWQNHTPESKWTSAEFKTHRSVYQVWTYTGTEVESDNKLTINWIWCPQCSICLDTPARRNRTNWCEGRFQLTGLPLALPRHPK